MPPRHTKSEFASYLLPAWMVGRNPKLKIIQSTNTTELSVRFGRKAKQLLDSPKSIKVYLKLDLEKIHKLQVNGKHSKAVSITQPVLAQQLQDVAQIYLSSMTRTLNKML